MTDPGARPQRLPMHRVVQAWWPLALSWLLMGVERPMIISVIARLPDSEVHLAAFGGVVGPLLDAINAPIIMLLAASTALSKDWASYRKLWRFMNAAGLALSVVHALIAFTPLYYTVTATLIHAPEVVIEPSRLGLMIGLPWSWVIAYRRVHQGVLIRFGHSRSVGAGTIVRLASGAVVLLIGYSVGTIPGVAVAAGANVAGVIGEATFIGMRARKVVREQLRQAPVADRPLTLRGFVRFYAPLALTTMVLQTSPAIGSAALSRMPNALESLAVWPVLNSLSFLLRSAGLAYNEVVVAMLDLRGALRTVRRFAMVLAVALLTPMLIMAATPLSTLWFGSVSGLSKPLVAMGRTALWITLPMAATAGLQSLFQGALVHSRRTRAVIEAVTIVFGTSVVVMLVGMAWGRIYGVYVAAIAFTLSGLAQTLWLWYRSRPALRAVRLRDEALRAPQPEVVAVS